MTKPLHGKRILVVEDSYLAAEELCDTLRSAGALPIGPVGSVADAINTAEQEQLDGVLLDVGLQSVNGSKVAEYLRLKKVPFVLVTGFEKAALHPELKSAPYLTKPVLRDDLVKAILSMIALPQDERAGAAGSGGIGTQSIKSRPTKEP